MANFLAHTIAEDIFQWHKDTKVFTQVDLGNKIAETIERIRIQQPNELRPSGTRHCMLSDGEHDWKGSDRVGNVKLCLCGAVSVPKDSFPG